jgi:Acyl-CoA reductase (LuxC)
MSDVAHRFASTTVLLPFALDDLVAGWVDVRRAMLREVPDPFSRDEWAHLAASLDPVALRAPFATSFGDAGLARARGHVAVWLPNNVSLLGPLTSILLSLTGAPVTFKVGTRGDDLMTPWLEFVRAHAPAGPLRRWAVQDAALLAADRDDPRVAELAAAASARIVFGSDVAIEAIERLPHPAGSLGFGFGDRRSEAWIEPAAMSDATVRDLVRVFAIFGQAGCTSPRRAVLLGGGPADALALRDALVDAWPRVQPGRSAMHVASANVAARQRAAVAGWDAVLTPGNAATVAAGAAALPIIESPMGLFVCAATPSEAVATTPGNLQTIGHVVAAPSDPAWVGLVARAGAKRFVPLRAMHHFGPVWDGHAFWRALFEDVELVA